MVRLKTRYLLFEIMHPDGHEGRLSRQGIDGKKVFRVFRQSLLDNFGDFGMAQAQSSFALKFYNPATLTGILRVSRDHVRVTQAALTYVEKLNGEPVIIRVIRVSGTIKKSEQAAIARDKDIVVHALNE